MSNKGIRKKNNPEYEKKVGLKGQTYYKKKENFSNRKNNGSRIINYYSEDFISNKKIKNVNVSTTTTLCEKALCDDYDIDDISDTISAIDDSQRVVALRGLNNQEIKETLQEWKDDMIQLISEKLDIDSSDIVSVNTGNSTGNSSASDLVIGLSNNDKVNVETKFGSSTNSAIGISRMNTVLSGENCFQVNKEDKKKLVELYLNNPQEASTYLTKIQEEYIKDFNSKNVDIDSQSLTDIITSSGSQGNSNNTSNYIVVNFKLDNNGAYATETPLTINNEDKWNVTAELGESGNNSRVNYIFTSDDGQKRIKMTYNNKNSAYVDKNDKNTVSKGKMKKLINNGEKNDEDFLKIESNYQLSTGSYNVWYWEGITEE